jgi:hypothetical protein
MSSVALDAVLARFLTDSIMCWHIASSGASETFGPELNFASTVDDIVLQRNMKFFESGPLARANEMREI